MSHFTSRQILRHRSETSNVRTPLKAEHHFIKFLTERRQHLSASYDFQRSLQLLHKCSFIFYYNVTLIKNINVRSVCQKFERSVHCAKLHSFSNRTCTECLSYNFHFSQVADEISQTQLELVVFIYVV